MLPSDRNRSPGASAVEISVEGGRTRILDEERATIGRAADADVRIPLRKVSRRHGIVRRDGDAWVYEDMRSKFGSYVDGKRVERVRIDARVTVRLADPKTGPVLEFALATGDRRTVNIGRAADNDIVVEEPLVSRRHAQLTALADGRWELVDLGSTNGTFVDGRRVERTELGEGQQVTIGHASFRACQEGLERRLQDDVPALQARNLSVSVGKQTILDSASFSLPRNNLLAIVGPTGSGKTTLLKVLTGFQSPDAGDVLLNGQDLYAAFDELRRGIGYVPQEEVLHRRLSIRRALRFAATLRLPPDASRAERRVRVDEVLENMGLRNRSRLPIERASGGERKRTNIALELLTKPTLLFLDEPTSGLDVGFEKMLMESLRGIADEGRSVVVVTHTLQSLDLCDRVLVLALSGQMLFYGPPADLPQEFGTSDLAEVFKSLHTEDARAVASPGETRAAPPLRAPAAEPATPQLGWWRQLATLCVRQLALLFSDWRNVLYLVVEVLLPAMLILALVGSDALKPGTQAARDNARTLLGATAIAAAVIGIASSIREIVKERFIYLRERAVGLTRSAYLGSKLVVLGTLTIVQVVGLVFVTTRGSGGPNASLVIDPHLAELVADLALAGLAAVALGILISSFVASSEKAMALIPVLFIVEWLLSSIAMDLEDKPVLRQVGYATSANWGMAAASASVDLCKLADLPKPDTPTADERPPCDWRWKHENDLWIKSTGALIALTIVPMALSGRLLARQEPRAPRRRRRAHRRRERRAHRRRERRAPPAPEHLGPDQQTRPLRID